MSSNDQELSKIIDNIIIARVGLLLNHPFFGNLASRLVVKEGGEWCKTAATDGRHIFFNREFFSKLKVSQIQFVFAHEIMHNAFDHFLRREGRNPKIFNFASDYCVNSQLVRDKIGDYNIPDIQILHDTEYYGMTSEQIYDILKDKNDEMLDQLGELLDQHIDWESSDEDNPDRPVLSPEEIREIRNETREAIMSAAQVAGIGKTPAAIQRMIKEFTEPKMNWREIIRQQIQSVLKDDFTWMKPSKKAWHLSAVLPGSNVKDAIDICVSIDMSGSISDAQAKDFLSEIKGIMEEFKDFNLRIWCWDTEIYNDQSFDSYNIEDFDSYQPVGGGGTDMELNWRYMKDQEIVPKKFIVFTDGYVDSWGDESYCDSVFIIHGNDSIVPTHGEYAYYEFSK